MELSLDAKQNQSQMQKLILTDQMMESLKVLQMPFPALKEYIICELQENPLLEYGDAEGQDESSEGNLADEIVQIADSYQDLYDSHGKTANEFDPFYAISAKSTFSDYLLGQLSEPRIPPTLSKLCRYLIGDLDEKGYLRQSAEEIAADLKIKPSSVTRAIRIIQQLEPAGVGAMNLRECLSLQLKRMPGSSPCLFEIVSHNLKLLSENKIKVIAKKLDLPLQTAQKYCDIIRRLNPIPSSGFKTNTSEFFVIPEAKIVKNYSGKFEVVSNGDYLPKLHLNRTYLKILENPDSEETEKYIKSKARKARFLLSAVTNRKKTIVRILEKILELQPLCFEKGMSCLKPMSLKEMAGLLRLSESTVCRAVQDKYILCDFGLVRIKSFFTGSAGHLYGNFRFSSSSIQKEILNLVKKEDKKKPWSDHAIADFLKKTNKIEISRRAVTKYRLSLGIPSSSKRKVYSDTV